MTSDKTVISTEALEDADLLDARHLACPLPLFLLRRSLVDRPAGTRVRLWATAEATRRDLPGFCLDNRFRLVSQQDADEGAVFLVERL